MGKARVLLVERDRLIREGIKILLKGSDFEVCEDAVDLSHAASLTRDGPIDLIILDLPANNETSLAGLAELRAEAPDARIVILSATTDRTLIDEAINLQVNGFLLKDISSEALLCALQLAMLGEQVFVMHDHLLSRVGEKPVIKTSGPLPSHLSSREENILRCLTSGLSNKVIARRLSLSEATVKGHIKVIMRKINAQNRTQAAIWGLANGLEERNSSGAN